MGIFKLFRGWGGACIAIGAVGGIAGVVIAIVSVAVAMVSSQKPAWAVVLVTIVATIVGVGLLSIVFFIFAAVLGPEVKRSKVLETGRVAQAKIISLEDTGVTVNQIYPRVKMVLEVQPEGGEPYEVESKFLVNRLEVPQLQPGMTVPVTIDPGNPRNVALGAGQAAGGATGQAAFDSEKAAEEMLKKADSESQAIIASGVSAQAFVLEATSLDIFVNGNNPAMKFRLEVRPEGHPKFMAETTGVIAESSVPKYNAGETISVKYDPNDLTRVAIDHS